MQSALAGCLSEQHYADAGFFMSFIRTFIQEALYLRTVLFRYLRNDQPEGCTLLAVFNLNITF